MINYSLYYLNDTFYMWDFKASMNFTNYLQKIFPTFYIYKFSHSVNEISKMCRIKSSVMEVSLKKKKKKYDQCESVYISNWWDDDSYFQTPVQGGRVGERRASSPFQNGQTEVLIGELEGGPRSPRGSTSSAVNDANFLNPPDERDDQKPIYRRVLKLSIDRCMLSLLFKYILCVCVCFPPGQYLPLYRICSNITIA